MKKKTILTQIVVSILLCMSIVLAACVTTPPDDKVPVEVSGANAAFTLDLYGTKTKELVVSDYIDENGASGVTYERAASNSNVTLSAIADGKFTVTAAAEGSSTVTVKALQGGETKVSVNIVFTVEDSTPEPVPQEKAGAVKAFSLDLGDVFTKELSIPDYIDENGASGITYSVVKNNSRTELSDVVGGKFTVSAIETGTSVVSIKAQKDGDTVLTVSITFSITNSDVVSVTGLNSGVYYKITGDAEAIKGEPYSFSIQPRFGFGGTPVPSYKIGQDDGEPLTPDVNNGVYTFTIPALSVTGDITVTGVTGIDASTVAPNYDPDFFVPDNWALMEDLDTISGDDKLNDPASPVFEDNTLSFNKARHSYNTGEWREERHLTFNVKYPGADIASWSTSSAAARTFEIRFAAKTNNFKETDHLTLSYIKSGSSFLFILRENKTNAREWVAKTTSETAAAAMATGFMRVDIISVDLGGSVTWMIYFNGQKVEFFAHNAALTMYTVVDGNLTETDGGSTSILRGVWFSVISNGYDLDFRAAETQFEVDVSAVTDNPAYTLTAAATASNMERYTFSLQLNAGYRLADVSISATYSIEGVNKTVELVYDAGVYSYSIPVSEIKEDITITAIGGYIEYYNVAFPANPVGFGLDGEADVNKNAAYEFTLSVLYGFRAESGGVVVKYKIGDGNLVALTAVSENEGVYSYIIDEAIITGNVTIEVSGIEIIPATYNISLTNGAGYTLSGEPTAEAGTTYVFEMELSAGYIEYGVITATYSTDTSSNLTLVGVYNSESELYEFTIANVASNTVSAVSGMVLVHDVTGADSTADYTVTAETKAIDSSEYTVTITVQNSGTVPTVAFTVSGDITVYHAEYVNMSVDGTTFSFKIDGMYVSGDIALVIALADQTNITVVTPVPEKVFDLTQEEFQFDILDYIGLYSALDITFDYEILSAGEIDVSLSGGIFTVSIPGFSDTVGMSAIELRLWVLNEGVRVYWLDVEIDLLQNAAAHWFDIAKWVNYNGISGVGDYSRNVTALSDGSLSFVSTNKRIDGGAFKAEFLNGSDPASTITEKYSFMFFAPRDFYIALVPTNGHTHAAPNNRVDFLYIDGVLSLEAAIVNAKTEKVTATKAEAGYLEAQWNRFDIVLTRAEASGYLEIKIYINNVKVNFKTAVGETSPETLVGSGNAVGKLINGDLSVELHADGSTSVRYGNRIAFQTVNNSPKNGSPVRIAPIRAAASLRTFGLESDTVGTALDGASGFYDAANWTVDGGGANISVEQDGMDGLLFKGLSGTAGHATFTGGVAYAQKQHFTFDMYGSGLATGNAFIFQMRVTGASFYQIGIRDGRIVFSKSTATGYNGESGANVFAENQWNRVDIIITDTADKTEIEIYVNGIKIMFVLNTAKDNIVYNNEGTIVDTTSPIQSGTGFVVRTGKDGSVMKVAPYVAP